MWSWDFRELPVSSVLHHISVRERLRVNVKAGREYILNFLCLAVWFYSIYAVCCAESFVSFCISFMFLTVFAGLFGRDFESFFGLKLFVVFNYNFATTATGPDEIPEVLLQKCSPGLSPILCRLFKKCVAKSYFPSCLKLASIVKVVFKDSGERSDPRNYRPISLLSIMSKFFESLINSCCAHHLESFKVHVTRFSRKLLFLHQKEEYSILNHFVCFHWLEKAKEWKKDNFKVYKEKPLNTIFISCNLCWMTLQREFLASFVSFWSMFCNDMLKDIEWIGGCNNQWWGGKGARGPWSPWMWVEGRMRGRQNYLFVIIW